MGLNCPLLDAAAAYDRWWHTFRAASCKLIIETTIDACNPRTAGRELVVVSVRTPESAHRAFAPGSAASSEPVCLCHAVAGKLMVHPYGVGFTDHPHRQKQAIARSAPDRGRRGRGTRPSWGSSDRRDLDRLPDLCLPGTRPTGGMGQSVSAFWIAGAPRWAQAPGVGLATCWSGTLLPTPGVLLSGWRSRGGGVRGGYQPSCGRAIRSRLNRAFLVWVRLHRDVSVAARLDLVCGPGRETRRIAWRCRTSFTGCNGPQ